MPDTSTKVANIPDKIAVLFPRADYESVNTNVRMNSGIRVEAYHEVEITADAPGGHASRLPIHSTAIASFTGDVTPVNTDELDTLAAKIAADWYLWRTASLEVRYEGAIDWNPDGMHDVEIVHGAALFTSVHRSEWEPDYGVLQHAGAYGSAEEPPICGAQVIEIADGVLVHDKFDATIKQRDNGNEAWDADEPIWALDLNDAAALPEGERYPAVFAGHEVGGPYFISIVGSNTGQSLADTTRWIELVTEPGDEEAWSAGTYPAGTLKTHSGSTWVAKVATSGTPGVSSDWVQVTLSGAGGYSTVVTYSTGQYVQEVRRLFAFRSSGDGFLGEGSLSLGEMTLSGRGYQGTELFLGDGALAMSDMTMAGAGLANPYGVFLSFGAGNLSLAAMTMSGSGNVLDVGAVNGPFTAHLSSPAIDPDGYWVYAWAEQAVDAATGAFSNKAGGRSGDTISGPFMREVNNHLVVTPSYAHARVRGVVDGQLMYDFDRCFTLEEDDAFHGSGHLELAEMTIEAETSIAWPIFAGDGALALGEMTISGRGYAGTTPMVLGSGALAMSAMTMAASGTAGGGGSEFTPLGSLNVPAGITNLVLDVNIPTSGVLFVWVARCKENELGDGSLSIEWNGITLNFVTSTSVNAGASGQLGAYLYLYAAEVDAGADAIAVSFSGTSGEYFFMSAGFVPGGQLPGNAGADANSGSAPSVTYTTSIGSRISYAATLLIGPSGAVSWGPSYASAGQNTSQTISGTTVTLADARNESPPSNASETATEGAAATHWAIGVADCT